MIGNVVMQVGAWDQRWIIPTASDKKKKLNTLQANINERLEYGLDGLYSPQFIFRLNIF